MSRDPVVWRAVVPLVDLHEGVKNSRGGRQRCRQRTVKQSEAAAQAPSMHACSTPYHACQGPHTSETGSIDSHEALSLGSRLSSRGAEAGPVAASSDLR